MKTNVIEVGGLLSVMIKKIKFHFVLVISAFVLFAADLNVQRLDRRRRLTTVAAAFRRGLRGDLRHFRDLQRQAQFQTTCDTMFCGTLRNSLDVRKRGVEDTSQRLLCIVGCGSFLSQGLPHPYPESTASDLAYSRPSVASRTRVFIVNERCNAQWNCR